MKKYHFSEAEFACLETLRVPLAVYQFLDKRVVTRVLSAGFCDLFDFESREQAYAVMTSDMYSTAHPDDASRVADTAYRFATQGGRYEVVYRVKARRSSTYKIVHSIGEHVFTDTGERLAFVWYTDEGSYIGDSDTQSTALRSVFRSALRE
ncbi:MAG: PAS domain-containing protein, partial [Eubacteriales bacterium]|nr:PAS domain-containing protein [Eubacteriales bacterium]